MDYLQFNYTLDMPKPPENFHDVLKALWWERKGDWNTAHSIIKDITGKDAALVHAYLHRKEGDSGDAHYWYTKASCTMPDIDVVDEFREITNTLLQKYS